MLVLEYLKSFWVFGLIRTTTQIALSYWESDDGATLTPAQDGPSQKYVRFWKM